MSNGTSAQPLGGTQRDPNAGNVQQGPSTPASFNKQLDRALTIRAARIPQEWRLAASLTPESIAEDILSFVNGLDDDEYFFVEYLAVAFAESAKKDVFRKLAVGDPATVQAAFSAILEDAGIGGK
jgi:hypothetical protein